MADRLVFWLAPWSPFTGTAGIYRYSFANGALLADLNIGILFIVAVSSISAIGTFMAGYASNNKYHSLERCAAVASVVSYEIPVVLFFGRSHPHHRLDVIE
jgi:NADH-quinone oxidoreductase subunit H